MWFWIILIAIDAPLWVVAGRLVFGSWGAFGEALDAAFPSRRWSWWTWSWWDDDDYDPTDAPTWGGIPGLVFIAGCAAMVGLEYYTLRHFGIGP
jgi:hypothetical protein